MLYVSYAGLRGRTDRSVGIVGEVPVFAGSRFRCPLTKTGRALRRPKRLGARHLPAALAICELPQGQAVLPRLMILCSLWRRR